ncbi:hypothetical protein SR39_08465 [Methylobacterium radiotolerans]|nr:hypothetical protein SR39_08465 [Methylobacterium radiotolerans]
MATASSRRAVARAPAASRICWRRIVTAWASWIAWALSAITPRIRKERVLITVHLAGTTGRTASGLD